MSETAGVGPERTGLLCATTFGTNEGYAWDYIEGIYRDLSIRLSARGVDTWVAYQSISSPPETLAGSPARPVELPFDLSSREGTGRLFRFVRDHGIRGLYLPDHPTWHPGFAVLRYAGIRWIVVHDHTSGSRTPPSGPKRAIKKWSRRMGPFMADRVIAVSDFVASRVAEVDLVPRSRIRRIWNFAPRVRPVPGQSPESPASVELPSDRPLVMAFGRAEEVKGFHHLFRAFDRALANPEVAASRPMLVYCGNGPFMAELEAIREALPARESVLLLGYVPGASSLLDLADLCVVPSVWEEAFGLTALEPMEHAVPVIASRVGGIPEVVADGETGLLVSPGDEGELAEAMERLLLDPAEAKEMGLRGRDRARRHFDPDAQFAKIERVVSEGL